MVGNDGSVLMPGMRWVMSLSGGMRWVMPPYPPPELKELL